MRPPNRREGVQRDYPNPASRAFPISQDYKTHSSAQIECVARMHAYTLPCMSLNGDQINVASVIHIGDMPNER